MSDFLQQLGADLDQAAERRLDRRRRTMLVRATAAAGVVAAAVVLWIVLPGSWPTDRNRQTANERESTNQLQAPVPAATTTTRAPCDLGARPRYFVPGDGPVALVGCAQLPVSRQRVEFSADLSRVDGAEQLCINPAYGDGRFIPAVCKLNPPLSEFAVRDARQPHQGVKGYGYVIWGTAGSARSVDARFDGGIAHAARLPVPEAVARDYGVAPFVLFVAELPLSAACGPVSVEADGEIARVDPKPDVCDAAPKQATPTPAE